MPWQIVTLLFKLASASNILSLIFSGSWNVSKSFFYVNFFADVTASKTFLSFHTTSFLIYVSKFAFTKFLWLSMYSWMLSVLTSLHQLLHLHSIQISLAALSVLFDALLSLLASFLFCSLIFVKCHMDLSTWDKEVT